MVYAKSRTKEFFEKLKNNELLKTTPTSLNIKIRDAVRNEIKMKEIYCVFKNAYLILNYDLNQFYFLRRSTTQK